MNGQGAKTVFDVIKRNLIAILFFVFIVAVFFNVVGGASRKSDEEEKRIAEESLSRAAVTCYAIEGRYPEDYEYIKEHYGVIIDETKFAIVYDVFASNIMPEIRVVKR